MTTYIWCVERWRPGTEGDAVERMATWDEAEATAWAREAENYWICAFPMGGKLRAV